MLNDCIYCSGTNITDIVAQLASNRKLMVELKQIHSAEYTNDMIQDMWLYLLERVDEDKLINLCSSNQIKWFLLKIIKTQTQSSSSTTAVRYRNPYNYIPYKNQYITPEVIKNIMGHNDDTHTDLTPFNTKVEEILDKLHFYDREIFLYVVNSGKTYKELEKELKISHYNIGHTYRKVREILQNKLKGFNFEGN